MSPDDNQEREAVAHRTLTLRLYPTPQQADRLSQWADADLNAAINILRRGRASVLPVDGSDLDAPDEAGTSGRAA